MDDPTLDDVAFDDDPAADQPYDDYHRRDRYHDDEYGERFYGDDMYSNEHNDYYDTKHYVPIPPHVIATPVHAEVPKQYGNTNENEDLLFVAVSYYLDEDGVEELVLAASLEPATHQYTRPAGHPPLVAQLARRYTMHVHDTTVDNDMTTAAFTLIRCEM